ncbi:MAG: hypothetical protein DYG89_07810 [Caldilinea sp. CFX5]|nr:hypothetical protein [Caldilinea sp. CFX5]
MAYYSIAQQRLHHQEETPAGFRPLKHNLGLLLPPLVSELHVSFRAWGELGYSPAPLAPKRVYLNAAGQLAFWFDDEYKPQPLSQVGIGPDLAGWLVLLDKWMETYVVIARARTTWNLRELASALSFVTPAFLPTRLVAHPPDNWERVALALALTIADGPIQGTPTNQHWQQHKQL